MNLVHTTILGVLATGAFALTTPAQAHDRDDNVRYRDREIRVVEERPYYHHHHHHHFYGNRTTIVSDNGVSIAFSGHRRYHGYHRDFHRDWRDDR